MFGLSRKKKPLIGIDISSTAIKLIELSQLPGGAGPRFRVEHSAIEPLPAGAVVEKKIADAEQVGKALRKAVVSTGTRTRRAAAAVAGSAVITKIISMSEAFGEAEIENQIQLDADQYIPYPLEEVNLDFQVLGRTAGNSAMVDVLLVASRQENVDDRVSVLEQADLTPVVVDVEAYAMANACALLLNGEPEAQRDPSETVAVADIGAASMTLHVLHQGRIVYTREQSFGGQQLLDEVQRRYGLSKEVAAGKIIDGEVADGYQRDVLGPFNEALAQQIGRALQFFYSGSSFNRVSQVVLAGRPAGIPEIDLLVADRLRLPTRVANPFHQMSLAPTVSRDLMREAPGMMIAVGLALRGFD